MNILITGANGQLGNEMRVLSALHNNHKYFFTDVAELDITDLSAVEQFTRTNNIDIIVNCAAYTNVDKAEQDEPTAMLINAKAVENLGIAASKIGAKVIHVSTDYVFSGSASTPYQESEPTNPNTAYGRTKLSGEQQLIAAHPEAIVLRTAWLYSEYGNNFVKTMLRLAAEREEISVVFDQIGTPTYALDLAKAIFCIIESKDWHSGIYHFTNEGVCSWYDFALEAIRAKGFQTIVKPIRSSEYPSKTLRPSYSVLDKSKFKKAYGMAIPHWREALGQCLNNL